MVSVNPGSNAGFLDGYVAPTPAPAMPMPTMPTMPAAPDMPMEPPPRPNPRTAEPVNEYESTEFERLHGRLPTYQERVMIRAVPVITQQLGRAPSRIELLQFLAQRDNAPTEVPQFETMQGAELTNG